MNKVTDTVRAVTRKSEGKVALAVVGTALVAASLIQASKSFGKGERP